MQLAITTAELNDLFRGVTLTRPTNWYVGLDLNASGTAYSEPTYTGYARQTIARGTSAWTDPVANGGYVTNANPINFPAPPGGYTAAEIANRYFVATTATAGGGELVFDFATIQPLTFAASQVPQLVAGSLYIGQ